MIEEQGRVVATEGQYAWVETAQSSMCGQCAARKGCGTAVLSSVFDRGPAKVRVLNRIQAGVGELVVLGLTEKALLQGSLAVYLVPVLALLMAAGLAQWIWRPASESIVIIAGMMGLAMGLLWLRRFSRRISADHRYQPVILRRVAFPLTDCHT